MSETMGNTKCWLLSNGASKYMFYKCCCRIKYPGSPLKYYDSDLKLIHICWIILHP